MKKNIYHSLFILASFVLLLFLPTMTSAAPYKVKDRLIELPDHLFDENEEDHKSTFSLIHADRSLTGLMEEVDYFYSIPNHGIEKDSFIQLDLEYSGLLLPTSSVTISIDGQKVKSEKLDHKDNKTSVKIPLKGKYATPGSHDVKVSFYGELTKEVCQNESSPANWLTILSSSTVQLNEKASLPKKDVLDLYPYPFVKNEEEATAHATIVVPNKASSHTLTSALQVASYLNHAAQGDTIEVVYEKDLKKIATNIIAIGPLNEWEEIIKDFSTSTKLKTEKDKLLLENYFLSTKDKEYQLLLVSAEHDKTISDKIHVLTNPDFIDQLSGEHLQLGQLPKEKPKEAKALHTFKEMSIPNLSLSGRNKTSQMFFYQLPSYVDTGQDAQLDLKLNFSQTLLEKEEKDIEQAERAELVILVNGMPHSLALDELTKEADKEYYEVSIPIEGEFLKNEQYVTVEMTGNGLHNHGICEPPRDDDWIFVHEDSAFHFPINESYKDHTFEHWPAPFFESQLSDTTVVLPKELSTQQLLDVSEFIQKQGEAGTIVGARIVYEGDYEQADLKGRNVIVFGHLKAHPSLQKHADDLLVQMDQSDVMDVHEFGFLQETAKHLAWIQPSIWDKNQSLVVVSPLHSDEDSLIGNNMIDYLESNTKPSEIIVESKNGGVFTYPSQNELEEKGSRPIQREDRQDDLGSIWLMVGLGFILLIGVIVLIVLFRQRKRNSK